MVNLDNLRTHLIDELVPDPREKGKYICPICGSGAGSGRNHDGAFSIYKDGIHGKCFSCGFYGDIFDLELAKDGLDSRTASRDEKAEAVRSVSARYAFAADQQTAARTPAPPPEQLPSQDFSAYLAACHSSLKGSDGESYLRSRGIQPQTMNRFNLGYDAAQRRIIIPYDRKGTYYSTRAIDPDRRPRHDKPAGVKSIIFNAAALYQDKPCFIVESPLCAISVMQEGGSAIALSGVGTNLLLSLLDAKRPSAPLILCFDNDQPKEDGSRPGPEAQAKLAEELTARGIFFIERNIAEDCKDPNELLQRDQSIFNRNVSAASLAAEMILEKARQGELEEYEARTTAADFASFEAYLAETAGRPPVPTGFTNLDRILNGGLSAGLYIMGAISSLGKTSWMLNIADNISAAGRDVLYFSLEMSRNELIAKSLSRLSFRIVGEQKSDLGSSFSTFEVLHSGSLPDRGKGRDVLLTAMRQYRETVGAHMWMFEGVGSFGVETITKQVDEHIRITGRKPVVFIDYLQILAPVDPRSTDKQNTDRAVVELKRLSALQDIPIFCISSLNRSNYTEPISMSAFKESGAIEYGSDVLIGLQPYGMDFLPGEKTATHNRRVRNLLENTLVKPQIEIEIKVLKNRNGSRGGSGTILFDKKYNAFREIPMEFTRSSSNIFGPEEEDEEDEDDGPSFSL